MPNKDSYGKGSQGDGAKTPGFTQARFGSRSEKTPCTAAWFPQVPQSGDKLTGEGVRSGLHDPHTRQRAWGRIRHRMNGVKIV